MTVHSSSNCQYSKRHYIFLFYLNYKMAHAMIILVRYVIQSFVHFIKGYYSSETQWRIPEQYYYNIIVKLIKIVFKPKTRDFLYVCRKLIWSFGTVVISSRQILLISVATRCNLIKFIRWYSLYCALYDCRSLKSEGKNGALVCIQIIHSMILSDYIIIMQNYYYYVRYTM